MSSQSPVVVIPGFGPSPSPTQKQTCVEYSFCFYNLTLAEDTQNPVKQNLQNPYFLGGSSCAAATCPVQTKGNFGRDEQNFFNVDRTNGCLYGKMVGARDKGFYTLTQGLFRPCPDRCIEALFSSIPEKECGFPTGGDSLTGVTTDGQSGGGKPAQSKLPNPNGVNSGNANDNNPPIEPAGSNIGLIAGVIAGVAVLLIFGAIGLFILRRRRNRRTSAKPSFHDKIPEITSSESEPIIAKSLPKIPNENQEDLVEIT